MEPDKKSVLRQLMELYAYDFSEYDQADVNDCGLFGYKYLDHYWTEPDRHPFFIRVNGCLAGFVLVSGHCCVHQDGDARSISEFFVLRKYRKKGVGKFAARRVFDMFPGKWQVFQIEANVPAQRFWERVVDAYTDGKFEKQNAVNAGWEGQALVFDNSTEKEMHL